MDVLGIDISKADFHACLIQGEKRSRKSFPNAAVGYRQLHSWRTNLHSSKVHACMEATGAYWMGLATALDDAGLVVSVVHPSRTVMFARSQLRRTKTDEVDAEMIAEFCKTQTPTSWSPPPGEILELRGLLSYRDHLVREKIRLRQVASQIYVGRELQKLHAQQLKTHEKTIAALERQLRSFLKTHQTLSKAVDSLTAVSGIGLLTALAIVAKLPVDRLRDRKAAAAYIGVTPSERQSGTSIHGKPRICKTGNGSLRRDLYMPAAVAMRHNVILKSFSERLKAKGQAAQGHPHCRHAQAHRPCLQHPQAWAYAIPCLNNQP